MNNLFKPKSKKEIIKIYIKLLPFILLHVYKSVSHNFLFETKYPKFDPEFI